MEDRMTNREKTAFAVKTLENLGCDKGQCMAAYTRVQEVTALSGRIELLRTVSENVSMNLTACKDGKKGSILISSGEPEEITAAAAACLENAKGGKVDETPFMNEDAIEKEFSQGKSNLSVEKLLERTDEFLQDAKERYPKAHIRQLIVLFESQEKYYQNTAGVNLSASTESCHFSFMISGFEGDQNSSFYSYSFSFDDLDTPLIERAMVAKCLDDAQKMVHTVKPEEKRVGTLIVPPHCLRNLVGQIIDAFASPAALIGGGSRWQNSLGTQVADPGFTLHSRPLSDEMAKNTYFTGDGFLTENQTIIEKGVLKSLCPDYYTSQKTGIAPYHGAGCYVVEPGDKSLEEILAETEYGIIINRFSGGRAAASGELSGIAKNSFFVRNGKVEEASRETMISCNLADLLQNIQAISKELVCDGGSQLPYIAFRNVTIF